MIAMVDAWQAEVVERMVVVDAVDSECPATAVAIDRTIEIVERQETCILGSIEHITKVFVAIVEQAIVLTECIVGTKDNIRHQVVDGIDEIIVNLVAIFILHRI